MQCDDLLPCLFDSLLVFPFWSETEERVSVGLEKACSEMLQGQLWFNPLKKGLYLCDGTAWITVLEGENPLTHEQVFTQLRLNILQKSHLYSIYSDHKRLDYVLEHQVLTTSSETHDVEVSFHFVCTIAILTILVVKEIKGTREEKHFSLGVFKTRSS